MLVVVTGDGGTAGTSAAEATSLFWLDRFVSGKDIVASAAFRFLVMGGMVTTFRPMHGKGESLVRNDLTNA